MIKRAGSRENHSAENRVLIRRLALNLLRRRAVLSDDYRFRLRFGQPSPATT